MEKLKVNMKAQIHNKFEIEVKDITTGKIVQKGYAENIVLNGLVNAYVQTLTGYYFGNSILYGRGTGVLSPERTTLFDYINGKSVENVEYVINQIPVPSYRTTKIVILPAESVGEIITEVGIGFNSGSSNAYTHALIKDSEGNQLALGPKTDTQEITIYATVYVTFIADTGIQLRIKDGRNSLMDMATGYTQIRPTDDGYEDIWVNGSYVAPLSEPYFIRDGWSLSTVLKRLETAMGNGKIKTLSVENSNTDYNRRCWLILYLETLAENASTIWSGYNFLQTPVGVGDGTTQTFNLTWDEVWEGKPKAVYVDGVEAASGVTWTSGSITFDTAPADQAIITADYWVKYIPKDIDHVVDFQISLTFGQGGPA